mmetsp:Transcript_14861/g.22861  ORF Transcript_14861/g.22861 Transcript_14861/m.22861 type:complete len:98 (-) Transcript_14861:1247-1540(-)
MRLRRDLGGSSIYFKGASSTGGFSIGIVLVSGRFFFVVEDDVVVCTLGGMPGRGTCAIRAEAIFGSLKPEQRILTLTIGDVSCASNGFGLSPPYTAR